MMPLRSALLLRIRSLLKGLLYPISVLFSLMHDITDLISPCFCAGCGRPVQGRDNYLCIHCAKKIKLLDKKCPICSGEMTEKGCEICSDRAIYFKRNVAISEYQGVMKSVLQEHKFHSRRSLSLHTGGLACTVVEREFPQCDIITAVPMSRKKKWQRGFNQSELLARHIARKTGTPCSMLLKERRGAGSQKELGYRNRFINILERYRVKDAHRVAGKKVLLVDDIMTTGATINECARVLKKAGADEIFSLTMARTLIKKLENI